MGTRARAAKKKGAKSTPTKSASVAQRGKIKSKTPARSTERSHRTDASGRQANVTPANVGSAPTASEVAAAGAAALRRVMAAVDAQSVYASHPSARKKGAESVAEAANWWLEIVRVRAGDDDAPFDVDVARTLKALDIILRTKDHAAAAKLGKAAARYLGTTQTPNEPPRFCSPEGEWISFPSDVESLDRVKRWPMSGDVIGGRTTFLREVMPKLARWVRDRRPVAEISAKLVLSILSSDTDLRQMAIRSGKVALPDPASPLDRPAREAAFADALARAADKVASKIDEQVRTLHDDGKTIDEGACQTVFRSACKALGIDKGVASQLFDFDRKAQEKQDKIDAMKSGE